MSKDPAFLFYPGDWDGGTKLFTRHVKGAYMDLLICQFHCGHMTSHDVGQILGQDDFNLYWESKLKAKFKQDSEGKYYNERLEEEQIKRRKWCESRKNNKSGKNQYSGHTSGHMTSHMEDEDENENINIPYKDIVNLYHEILPMLSHVIKLSEKRKKQIKARWFEDDKTQNLDWWRKFFTLISGSKFLTGENDRGWKPDLEWITKQENFLKICEEKYNNGNPNNAR